MFDVSVPILDPVGFLSRPTPYVLVDEWGLLMDTILL